MSSLKPKHRFFVSPQNIIADTAIIGPAEYHHLVDVLRHKVGDPVSLVDGQGNEYLAKLKSIKREKKEVELKIEEVFQGEKVERSLILVPGLVRSAKMDFIIQQATELGVTHIFPVVTKNSVVKLDEKKRLAKIEKWQRIIQSAAKQCGRLTLPLLDRVGNYDEIFPALSWVEQRYICTVLDIEKQTKIAGAPKSVAVLVGPEGGFSEAEVELARRQYGWLPLSLGKNRLRAQTAAVASLSVIGYQLGYW